MKYTHRSEKLDAFLGQNVKVKFYDGSWVEGVLGFTEKFEPPRYLMPNRYNVLQNNGVYYSFLKSHVKSIENIKRELS